MKLLLDTNVFIWLNDAPQRVRAQVMTIIANPDNDLFLSLTSIWEMQIKILVAIANWLGAKISSGYAISAVKGGSCIFSYFHPNLSISYEEEG